MVPVLCLEAGLCLEAELCHPCARYLLGRGDLLGHETQLLLPLLSHPGDDGVEEAELLALLVHLVVGVFEHHLEAVVSQDAGEHLLVGKVGGERGEGD